MKVLHLAIKGGEQRGGLHEVAYHLSQHQRYLGIDAQYWYPGDSIESERHALDPHTRVLKTFGHPGKALLRDLVHPRLDLDFDILHQHGIWLPVSLLTTRFRKQQARPIVIQLHGALQPYYQRVSRFKKRIVSFLYERQNLHHADLLLACSSVEASHLETLFPGKDIAVIPNGIPQRFIDQHPDDPEKMKQGKEKMQMLFLSRIHPLKGLERLLRAIQKIGVSAFSDWQIVIAGMGNPQYSAYLKDIAEKAGLGQLVYFTGPKFGQEKINLLANSDIMILPTFSESFGIVVAEALGRGVPVFTTEGAPWSEIETHRCGWWVSNDDEGIINGLLDVLRTSPDKLKLMGERGKQLVQSKYTWEAIAPKTIELYEWVINKDTRKPSFVNEEN